MKEREDYMIPHEYDSYMETRKWIDKIPFIEFPANWKIQIIPPFGGASIRFRVKNGKSYVSIYLDCYDNLGCVGEPYWEVYPYQTDTFRCGLNETDKLISAIQEILNETAS
jgi:hypothetical protein